MFGGSWVQFTTEPSGTFSFCYSRAEVRIKTYRNVTTGEEVVGDQAEGDVVHMSFNWSHMFGCDKVDGGRLELQTGQSGTNDVYMRFSGVQTREVYTSLMICVSSRGNTQQLNSGLISELCEPLQL